VPFDADRGHEILRFDSMGFRLVPLVRGTSCRVGAVHLAPGGRIGRHRAVGAQVLAVVAGSGEVAGADGVLRPIGAGVAAVWDDGEEHETRTAKGLTAMVFEGDGLEVAASR
jgi:quercetin dioxygenase-like cupin family protein